MSVEEAILLAGKVIKENMEQKINKDNFEIAYLRTGDKKLTKISPAELDTLIPRFV